MLFWKRVAPVLAGFNNSFCRQKAMTLFYNRQTSHTRKQKPIIP
jgi:hypothetical protein